MGSPAAPTPPSMPQGLTLLENTLTSQQKAVYSSLQRVLDGGTGDEGSLSWMFAGLENTITDIWEDFNSSLSGSKFLEGTKGGSSAALGLSSNSLPSKPIKASSQLHPTPEQLMLLPVEFSMGYLLIYDQLVKMSKKAEGPEERKEKKLQNTIGGFFSNLLKGAEGLALIAVGLVAFAGAMLIFPLIEWEPALKGLISFGIFITSMVILSKLLGNNMKDFQMFATGILLITVGMIAFNAAIWLAAKIEPYWPPAEKTLIAYGLFVGGMALIARTLGKELGNFMKFAGGVLLLIGGLVLFDIAIVATALILPFIPNALEGLKLFGIFVASAAGLALILNGLAPSLIQMSLSLLLLDAAAILFAGALLAFAYILPKIPAAKEAIVSTGEILGQIAVMALASVLLAIPLAAFAVSLLLVSAAFLAWSAALVVIGKISDLIPAGLEGIKSSFGLLEEIGEMAKVGLLSFISVAAFAIELIAISAAFTAWSAALALVGKLSPLIPAGLEGIRGSLGLLQELEDMSKVGIVSFVKTLAFAGELLAISVAFTAWSTALALIGKLSPLIPAGLDGIRSSLGLLQELEDMSKVGIWSFVRTLAFAGELAAISAAFTAWSAALVLIGKLSPLIPAGLDGIRSSLGLLQELEDMSKAGVISFLRTLAFTGELVAISAGITAWSAALSLIGKISEKIPAGLEGIQSSLTLLEKLEDMSKKGLISFIQVLLFSAKLNSVSESLTNWSKSLSVIGGMSSLIPGGLKGIESSIGLIKELETMASGGLISFVKVLAFSSKLDSVSSAFISWGTMLKGMSEALVHIPNALKGIEDSMEVLEKITKLSSEMSSALTASVMFSSGIQEIASVFESFATMIKQMAEVGLQFQESKTAIDSVFENLKTFTATMASFSSSGAANFTKSATVVRDGLRILTAEEKGIDKLATSLERVSKAIKAPDKSIWDTMSSVFSGGNVANTQTGDVNVATNKTTIDTSKTENILLSMQEMLARWEQYIIEISNNTRATAAPEAISLLPATRPSVVDSYSINGPIAAH